MPGHAWRLLVAGHLNLDDNLWELALAGDEQHEIIRDATLSAFELMIEAAVETPVDLLLLTGTLCTEHLSLRACTTFRDGVELLLEEGIPVAWAPIDFQEVETLQKLDCLPAGISVLDAENGQHSIELDASQETSSGAETMLGTVYCELISATQIDVSQQQDSSDSSPPGLSHIGITHHAIGHLSASQDVVNTEDEKYQLIISGESQRRQTMRHQNTLYHSPGALQGLSSQVIGPGCATLIEIDSQDGIELYPIKTSVVLRQKIKLVVQQEESLEELLQRAEQELSELLDSDPPGPEQLLHLSWEVRGPHTVLLQFSSPELQEFISSLQPIKDVCIVHEVMFAALPTSENSEQSETDEEETSEQFLRLLAEQNANQTALNIETLQQSLGSNSLPAFKLLSEVPHNELCHRATEIGLLAMQDKLLEAG